MPTLLGRSRINAIHSALPSRGEIHPGLRIAHGLDRWPEGDSSDAKHKLIAKIAELEVPAFYKKALERWQQVTADKARFHAFSGDISQRLYIGVTRDSPLETGVTVSHSYGMPIIPGSSLKGLARATATYLERNGSFQIRPEVMRWLFGEGGDTGESGGLYFHDAWWTGSGEPFVAEIVTPHHTGYYGKEGKEPASDTDSPIPVPQIAVQGGFYFVIEGDAAWTPVAAALLQNGLQQWGIGGKKSSGYGRFDTFIATKGNRL